MRRECRLHETGPASPSWPVSPRLSADLLSAGPPRLAPGPRRPPASPAGGRLGRGPVSAPLRGVRACSEAPRVGTLPSASRALVGVCLPCKHSTRNQVYFRVVHQRSRSSVLGSSHPAVWLLPVLYEP